MNDSVLRLNTVGGSASADDAPELDAAEVRARRALGLAAGTGRGADHNRPAAATGSSTQSGQRRRFARDGDVQVVVSSSLSGGVSNRLAEALATLDDEQRARRAAEREVAELRDRLRSLETKLNHSEMARQMVEQQVVALEKAKGELEVELVLARLSPPQQRAMLDEMRARRSSDRTR